MEFRCLPTPTPIPPSPIKGLRGREDVTSVGRPQDLPDLGVLGHECSQPVIVMRILPCDVAVGERQVAVSVQTGRDPQSVGRQVAFETIVADDVVEPMAWRVPCSEAAVAQRPELPIPTRVVLGHPLGDAVDDRFQLQREMNAEEFLRDGQALISSVIPKASADRSPSKQVVADHVVEPIAGRCHVEAAVGQRPELPVSAVVILGHPLGDAVDDRFQLQREMNAEELSP